MLTRLGVAYVGIISGSLYPTVSIGWQTFEAYIRTNFGLEPFKYDLDKHWTRKSGLYYDDEFNTKNVLDRQIRELQWDMLSNAAHSPDINGRQSPPFSTEQPQVSESFGFPSGAQNSYTLYSNFPSIDDESFHATLFADGSTNEDFGYFDAPIGDTNAKGTTWPPLFDEVGATAGRSTLNDVLSTEGTEKDSGVFAANVENWPSLFNERAATAGRSNPNDLNAFSRNTIPLFSRTSTSQEMLEQLGSEGRIPLDGEDNEYRGSRPRGARLNQEPSP